MRPVRRMTSTASTKWAKCHLFTVNVTMPSGTLRNLGWFEVAQMRGAIKDGKVQRYQVTLKVGFTLE